MRATVCSRAESRPARRASSSMSRISTISVRLACDARKAAAACPARSGLRAKTLECIFTPAGTPRIGWAPALAAATSRAVPSPPTKRMRSTRPPIAFASRIVSPTVPVAPPMSSTSAEAQADAPRWSGPVSTRDGASRINAVIARRARSTLRPCSPRSHARARTSGPIAALLPQGSGRGPPRGQRVHDQTERGMRPAGRHRRTERISVRTIVRISIVCELEGGIASALSAAVDVLPPVRKPTGLPGGPPRSRPIRRRPTALIASPELACKIGKMQRGEPRVR